MKFKQYRLKDGVPQSILAQLKSCDWDAAKHLAGSCERGDGFSEQDMLFTAEEPSGLCAFLTLAKRGFLPDSALSPWVGFVHALPAYRGKGCIRALMNEVFAYAGAQNIATLYLAANQAGFYEKFGFAFVGDAVSFTGEAVKIYQRGIAAV